MDWPCYRKLCDRPDVLSRWTLEHTLAVLDGGAAAAALYQVLDAEPLVRPADHVGPPATDMFYANLEAAVVRETLAAVEAARRDGRLAAALGSTSTVGFVSAWRDYARWRGLPDTP